MMLEPTSYFTKVSLIALSGISFEKEVRVSCRDSRSMTSQPCSNCPQRRVFQSFLLHEMMKITNMRRGKVTREKGQLQGSTNSIQIQIIVEITKIPPHLELLFSSCTLRKDRVTPGIMTSRTGSQEHFLKRLLTMSGTSKKMGDDSSPAQSLQESGRRKCNTPDTAVMVTTIIVMARQLSLSELKWKILILPTQIHPAIILYNIQLSKKRATVITAIVEILLQRSHTLMILQTGLRSLLMRKKVSLKQRNTKKMEKTSPKYLMNAKAFQKSLQVKKQRKKIRAIPTTLKIRKFFQQRTQRRGR